MKQGLDIHIKNLSKSFKDREVLKNLTLDIQAGSFVSILGPSGCGKSTLLRLIADLEAPSAGSLERSPGSSSFVFQDANLLPWRTVEENIRLPFEIGPRSSLFPEDIHRRVDEVLNQVQLKDTHKLFPHQLSGGMKMRVSLARALVSRPRLLLLDEPLAALDEATRFSMQDLLRKLWLQEKMTVLFVTHSVFEAVYLSQRVVLLSATGGHIESDQLVDLPEERHEELRTSEALNQIAAEIRQKARTP